MTEEAMIYLNEALDCIQQHSVRRELIDWSALRRLVIGMATEAKTPAETYPAIRRALELLGDRHSMFLDPETARMRMEGKLSRIGLQAVHPTGVVGVVYPGSSAEQAAIHVGDRLETINGLAISTLTQDELYAALQGPQATLTLTPFEGGLTRLVSLKAVPFALTRQPRGYPLAGALGYLEVPNAAGLEASKPFAMLAHQVIREIDQTPTVGWVIDLRTNTGGALYPMLAAVGPIAGEGELIGFVAPGEKQVAYYREGRAWLEGAENATVEVEEWHTLKRPTPPVAVLTSQLTASSGEFTALAFRGRQYTRSFGEPTRGVPTGNDVKVLTDGAWIGLTTALGTDRTGQAYDAPLLPDELVTIEWTRLGSADDPVLQAAIRWLRTEARF
ncbi:MAG TPA: S41 family peptidase [Ktedonobacterales bacterium]